MEKTFTTAEQNLAALNITEEDNNNNHRRDRRRPKLPDNRHAFHIKTTPNVTKPTVHPPRSTITVASCNYSWPRLYAQCPARAKQNKNCNRHGN